MMTLNGNSFAEIWLVDFEFSAAPGDRPRPICLVAWEPKSGRKLRIWEEELLSLQSPPYSTGSDALFVAYYASAELGCHLALGWPLPENVLDLFVEFRNLTNGLSPPCGSGLLGALAWFGLSGVEVAEKKTMRALALRGGPWAAEEQDALLNYCETDVVALSNLLPALEPTLDWPRALLRGQFMQAAAHIEHNGVPIDTETFERLQATWPEIQERLIARIDRNYGIYDGRTFKAALFEEWLVARDIPWLRLPSGHLDLKDDTFREMARAHPAVAPLRELRVALSQMRLSDLAVGADGRNRCLLSAFRARTGRNQPSNSRFIFGPAVWLRGLIKPKPGHGLAYIDWSQQEFGIAAALSGDPSMMAAYESGDPYLAFAIQAGAAPADATKASHRAIRNQFKACVLAVQYGMGAESLAQRIGQSVSRARELLKLHRATYQDFWAWSDAVVDCAMLNGRIWTTFGWEVHVGASTNPRFLRNFPMQANGAEMLRLACCEAIKAGIKVCAPVHDAILIEAPLDELEAAIETTKAIMSDASATVLEGFRLRSDAETVRHPDRYMDDRGRQMWAQVMEILEEPELEPQEVSEPPPPVHTSDTTCAPATTCPFLSL